MNNNFIIDLPELLNKIISYVSDDDLISVALVSKLWYSLSIPYLKSAYIRYFFQTVPEKMINALGGIKVFSKAYIKNTYNILKIEKQRDYIDYVNNNMMTTSIMFGVDSFKRRFFCFRFSSKTKTLEKINIVTIFQRYIGLNSSWNGCGHYNYSHIFDTSYGSINYTWLKDLIEGKEITVQFMDEEHILKLS